MLLSSDLHLDDHPENAYRWKVFERLRVYSDGDIYILGDLTDRADRHSGALVNRLVVELTSLLQPVMILCGNHDRPLRGVPYWNFLNQLSGVNFITEPSVGPNDLLMLPYSPNPKEDWKDLNFDNYAAIFMHQSVDGVDAGRGHVLSVPNMVTFPPKTKCYSGDIHYPQVVGPVTYVGAPHPVRFGDTHRCRFLRLDEHFDIKEEIRLRRIQKRVVEIHDVRQLSLWRLGPGDQVRIRFKMSPDHMAQWPVEQQAINAWAQEQGVIIASVEAVVESGPHCSTQQYDFDADPAKVLRAYCAAEEVDPDLLNVGLEFLQSVRG